MSNDRRVFVLSGNGEVGPYTNEDLRREVAAGTIQRTDQVRTASGKVLGTVGDLIGGHPHASGRMNAAVSSAPVAAPPGAFAHRARARSSDSEQVEAPQKVGSSSNLTMPALIIGTVVLLVAGGLWLLSGRTPAVVPTQPRVGVAATGMPRVRMSVVMDSADAQLGTQGLIRIVADKAPLQDVVITLQASGTAVSTEVQAIPEKVVLPAGQTLVEVPVVAKLASAQRVPPRHVIVRLMPGPGYELGGTIHATVTLKSGTREAVQVVQVPVIAPPVANVPGGPPPTVLPHLTREDFGPRNVYLIGGGQGWNGPWVGSGMEFVRGALTVSGPEVGPRAGDVPGLVPGPGLLPGLKDGTILLLDLGPESQQTPGNCNNLTSAKLGEPGSFLDSAVSSEGQATGVRIAVVDSFISTYDQGVDAAGLFPASMQKDAFHLDRASDGLGVITLTRLPASLVYEVEIFASTQWPDIVAVYTIGGASITLDPVNNTNQVARFANLVPDGTGAIVIETRIAAGSMQAVMGGLKITAHSLTPTSQPPAIQPPAPPKGKTPVALISGNTPPELSSLPDIILGVGRPSEILTFTVADKQTLVSSLKVSVSTSNPTLIATLVTGGTTAQRTLRVTPAQGQSGKTTITLTVSDGTLQATQRFEVTVTDHGHARIPAGDQIRRLAQRITGGDVWLSYYAHAPVGPDSSRQLTYSPWKSLGPFPADNHNSAFNQAFIEESGIDPQAPAQGPAWVDRPEWKDGESQMFAGIDFCYAMYLTRTMTVPQATSMSLLVGSDDGLRVWLNGQMVWSHEVMRGLDIAGDVIPLTLQPGVNRLLMKVTNGGGGGGFNFRDELPGVAVGIALCDGDKERIFTGYSRLRPGISVETTVDPKDHHAVLRAENFRQGTHVVVRLTLQPDHTQVSLWVDPQPGPAPDPTAYARFEAIAFDRIKLHVDPTLTWEIGDLRLGTSWAEVVQP